MGIEVKGTSPIIGPKKKLIEDVDRADVIAEAKKLEKEKKFRVLKSPPSGSRIPMRIKVPKRIKDPRGTGEIFLKKNTHKGDPRKGKK